MTRIFQNWDGGTSAADGVTVSAANTNGAGNTALTAVNAAVSSAVAFSSTQAHSGSLSCHFVQTDLADVTFPVTTTVGQRAVYRTYLYFVTVPAAKWALGGFYNSGGAQVASFYGSSTGTFLFGPSGDHDSGVTIQTGQWYRIEYGVTVGSTSAGSSVDFAIFSGANLETGTADYSSGTVADTTVGTTLPAFAYVGGGTTTSGGSREWYADDLAFDNALTSGYIGPSASGAAGLQYAASGTAATAGPAGLSFAAAGKAAATGPARLQYSMAGVVGAATPIGNAGLQYAASGRAASTGAGGLQYAVAGVVATAAVTPRGGRSYDMRLVGYTPLGARLGPIPDSGFTVTDTAAGPVLSAQVSTVVYGTLPTNLEVAVEWWHVSTQTWQEGRDSRFAVTQFDADDRDRTGTVTVTGLGLGAYLLAAAQLNGVDPYADLTGTSEAARTNTATSVSGTTWTWSSHVLSVGDRVRIVAKGNAKNINTGSVYYVINPTANTFQLARGATSSTAINAGTASNVNMARVVTRIVFTDTHKFVKSDSVSVLGGTALGLTDGSQYFVVNPTAATIQLTDKPGGVPIELKAASTNVTQVYRYLDGQRVFTNATPGTVMDAVFLEARGRGWGVGLDGTTQMLHGWTTGAGSDGVAWTKMADDPTTPGISIGFQPGTPGTQVLQALLDNQYAEWYTSNGRTIHLVNYGTGNDHSADTSPMRIGTTASAVKVQTDLTGLRNAITVRGTGPILTTQTATGSPWGRLETYETAQGATSKTLAAKQAATDLAANQNPAVGYQVTEMAQEAAWLPLKDYSRGDWIAVQLSGTGWTKLRCVGWSYAKDPAGAITVTSNLERVKRTLLTKQQKAIVTTSAGLSTTSTPGSTLQESDNRPPTYPLGVTVTTVGFFAGDDSAQATATVSWLPVTTDINGGDIQAVEYDVWIRPEGAFWGQNVGKTAGLSLDITPLAAGTYFEVSIRAQSSSGAWGELSPELEFQTNYPVTVPNPPTAPTVTGRLGQARVAWDGNLVDPNLGNTAASDVTQRGFAYVYVGYSTTSGGTYTQIGSNMGNAGAVSISALSIGTTYWFGLFAVNTVGVVSPMGTPTSYTIVGVTGPDLVANSVTANSILAGAITADKLDIGAVPPSGTPVDRVPQPATNSTYWTAAPNGIFRFRDATPSTSGLTLAPGQPTRQSITAATLPAPASGKVWINVLVTSAPNVYFYVTPYNSAGTNLGDTTYGAAVNGGATQITLPSTAVKYDVYVANFSATTTTTIVAAHVFEVIGGGGGGQAAELSPSGLRLFDNNGNLALDLTTSTQQFLNIYDTTAAEPISIASVDNAGNAQFSEVSADGFDIDGMLLADSTLSTSLINSAPNGSSWPSTPLLDRLGRGPIYDVTWPTQNGTTVTTALKRIAQDNFILEDGRSYMFDIQLAGLQSDLTSAGTVGGTTAAGVNCYLEFQVNLSPNASITSGDTINRAVIYNNTRGNWELPPIVWAASASQTTIDHVDRILPAGVPIYWQLNYNMSAAPSGGGLAIAEFGGSRGLTVIDLGSSGLTRPNGTDLLPDVHDYTTSGASSGSTSGGTVATTTTKTWTAAWSRTWNNSGSTQVTGTGQYTNGAAMYQGLGVTAMGSKFGFASLGISGKTITACYLYVKNTYFAYSGKSALLGTHGDATAPATYTGARANGWSVGWSQGDGKWINVPSSLWASIASGTIRGFTLGVDGSAGNYAYFQGATQTYPPKLKISYH